MPRIRHDARAGDARSRNRRALRPHHRAGCRPARSLSGCTECGPCALPCWRCSATGAPGELAVLLAALSGRGHRADRRRVLHRSHRPGGANCARRRCSRRTFGCSPGQPLDPAYEALAAERGIVTATHGLIPERRLLRRGVRADFACAPRAPAIRCAAGSRSRTRPSSLRARPRILPARGEAWLDSRLLARLGARRSAIASTSAQRAFTVTRVLDYRPDQGSAFVDLAPSLLISLADLEPTELLGPGSRVTWSLLFAGEPCGDPRVQDNACRSGTSLASGSSMSPRRARRSARPPIAPGASSIFPR